MRYGRTETEWTWWFELDDLERRQLRTDFAEDRYILYRHRGLDVDDAFTAVLSWQRNMNEQHIRRLSHDTGCTRNGDRLP